jgi:hypothetical protein
MPGSRNGSCWPADVAGGGPHRISYALGVPRSTVHKVLVRNGMSRLSDFDRPTGIPIRYVKDRPGQLLHVDVEKLGRIPNWGGWRVHGRQGHHHTGQGYDKLLTDNARNYTDTVVFQDALAGKVERFNRTLLEEFRRHPHLHQQPAATRCAPALGALLQHPQTTHRA